MSLAQKEIQLGHVETIEIPKKTIVHEHAESKAKYTAFSFVFPDGYPGTIVITKGIRTPWNPHKDLKRILFEFND